MTMKLSAPESIGEPLEEVVGARRGRRRACSATTALGTSRRAARDDDVTITATADLDADVDLITAAARRRKTTTTRGRPLSVKVGDDDVFSLSEASVDAPDAVEGVGRACFFTAFDANMRGFFAGHVLT